MQSVKPKKDLTHACITTKEATPEYCHFLAKTILRDILRLKTTPERLTRVEALVEDLLINKAPSNEDIYQHNCSIARAFIEESLGLAPLPKHIDRFVAFITEFEQGITD